jgi:hypothetical protein
MAHLAMQLERDPRLGGDPVPIVPSIAWPASSDLLMLSLMFLPEIAVAETDCGFVGVSDAQGSNEDFAPASAAHRKEGPDWSSPWVPSTLPISCCS